MSNWKPTTQIKRALEKFMRSQGVDEKTNEHAANLMLVWWELKNSVKNLAVTSRAYQSLCDAENDAYWDVLRFAMRTSIEIGDDAEVAIVKAFQTFNHSIS